MRNTNTIGLLLAAIIALSVFSCNTFDPVFNAPVPGKMKLVFDNVAGSADLKLDSSTYKNAAGESFTVTKFKYYVSNIRLLKEDSSDYVVPQNSSYFLIEEDKPASQTITLNNIPAGKYTSMTFLIGVDSLRSMTDVSQRTGVLDPGANNGMYWDWNSGYIFMKLEGVSSAAPATQNHEFFYHVGGFGRSNVKINNLRTTKLTFGNDAVDVQLDTTPTLRLTTDVLKIFNGSTQLSIAQHPSVMFDTYSTNIADNYKQMFSYDRVLSTK